MSELIVDEARGLTALDLLSTTYKKTSQAVKKSSKAALSLILVFFAFLGFNAIPTDTGAPKVVVEESVTSTEVGEEKSGDVPVKEEPVIEAASPTASPVAIAKVKTEAVNVKASTFNFAGLDSNGLPTGFTVADSSGGLGSLYITNRPPVLSEMELSVNQLAKTDAGAASILISQKLISDYQGFNYLPFLSYGKNGSWIPLVTKVTYLNSERLLSGNYLVTAIIKVESEVRTTVVIPATTSGRDLIQSPRQVITRLVLNPGKTEILSQAVYVVEKGVK
jgi:hypothetical protein